MKTGLLAGAMWLAILGYFALYHGIVLVSGIDQQATQPASGGPNPRAWLAQQDYIK